VKELIDQVWDFLSDNYIFAAAAAGVILLIIIIASVVKKNGKKKAAGEPGGGRDFFLEGEYDTMLKETAAARKNSAAAEPEQTGPQNEPEPEDAAAEVTPAEPEAADVPELAEVSGDELQPVHININIGKGQVLLGYEEDGQIRCTVRAEQEDAEEFHALEEELARMGSQDAFSQSQEQAKPEPAPEIILEKINLVKGQPVKKFGPDNFNTGRSGRVFTEEELKIQIKE